MSLVAHWRAMGSDRASKPLLPAGVLCYPNFKIVPISQLCCDIIVEILAWYVIFRILFNLRMELTLDVVSQMHAIRHINAIDVVLRCTYRAITIQYVYF